MLSVGLCFLLCARLCVGLHLLLATEAKPSTFLVGSTCTVVCVPFADDGEKPRTSSVGRRRDQKRDVQRPAKLTPFVDACAGSNTTRTNDNDADNNRLFPYLEMQVPTCTTMR